jgi:hypothetical protein
VLIVLKPPVESDEQTNAEVRDFLLKARDSLGDYDPMETVTQTAAASTPEDEPSGTA